MTGAVFRFNDIELADAGERLDARCRIPAGLPCFAGHFPGTPLLPAVAQIGMIEALIDLHSHWHATLAGGSSLKFSGRIMPGELLDIALQRHPDNRMSVCISSGGTVVTKGYLELTGAAHD